MSNKTDDYVATQFMIWEATGMRSESTSFSNYTTKKAEINARIKLFDKTPSFDRTPITLKVGETITLNDTNGVFNHYDWTSNSNGLTVAKNGNNLTITANSSAPENAQVKYRYYRAFSTDKISSKGDLGVTLKIALSEHAASP